MMSLSSLSVPVPLRFNAGEYAGYTVMHCHFLMVRGGEVMLIHIG